jgi:hypothetical protein
MYAPWLFVSMYSPAGQVYKYGQELLVADPV